MTGLIFSVLVLIAFCILSSVFFLLLTQRQVSVRYSLNDAPTISRGLKGRNRSVTSALFVVGGVVLLVEWLIPWIHDHLAEMQQRVAESLSLSASGVIDLSNGGGLSLSLLCCVLAGIFIGMIVGSRKACRRTTRCRTLRFRDLI